MTEHPFAVLIDPTGDRAEADDPACAVVAARTLLTEARHAGVAVPTASLYAHDVLVKAGVTRTMLATEVGVCWCGRGGLYLSGDRLPFCCSVHETLWGQWDAELRAKTIAARFIAIFAPASPARPRRRRKGPRPRPVAERFWPKVDRRGRNDCWPWRGSRSTGGYGRFGVGSSVDGTRRNENAHRVAYELCVGPIPEGQELDHLCRNRACVNPRHLEAVPHRENVVRGVGFAAHNAMKTHCPQGHPYDEENTYVSRKRGATMRHCLTCMHERSKRRREACIVVAQFIYLYSKGTR